MTERDRRVVVQIKWVFLFTFFSFPPPSPSSFHTLPVILVVLTTTEQRNELLFHRNMQLQLSLSFATLSPKVLQPSVNCGHILDPEREFSIMFSSYFAP